MRLEAPDWCHMYINGMVCNDVLSLPVVDVCCNQTIHQVYSKILTKILQHCISFLPKELLMSIKEYCQGTSNAKYGTCMVAASQYKYVSKYVYMSCMHAAHQKRRSHSLPALQCRANLAQLCKLGTAMQTWHSHFDENSAPKLHPSPTTKSSCTHLHSDTSSDWRCQDSCQLHRCADEHAQHAKTLHARTFAVQLPQCTQHTRHLAVTGTTCKHHDACEENDKLEVSRRMTIFFTCVTVRLALSKQMSQCIMQQKGICT